MTHSGKWHGKRCYFGLHYDLHAGAQDTRLGLHCSPRELVPALRLMGPQWVQTDCKGHPGMTSWFSRVENATVSPGVKKDALLGWRRATRELGLPLHCHYSGLWDAAAAEKRPEWAVVPNPAQPPAEDAWSPARQKMCPRGGYLEGLLIPQMLELIDRYEVDGFWVDGEIWAVEFCYCERCRAAFTEETGLAEPPTDLSDPHWVQWQEFQRRSFYDYVARYVAAVHAHKPGVLVTSNWMNTFKDPGEPRVETDWISGDTLLGLDPIRCEARFISTRGRPWDLMTWNFYRVAGPGDRAHPHCPKSVNMLKQEAATILALGGNFQIYENPPNLRDGRLIDWRMKRMGEVGRWVKARRSFCQGSQMYPQAAVLHSEHHFRSQPCRDLYFSTDVAPVEGAVFALLENHLSVDILDEWALLPRLSDFPLVVVPEQDGMSEEAVQAMATYVRSGGRLLVTGAEMYDRLGKDLLGARSVKQEEATHFVPAEEGRVALYSRSWRLLKPTTGRALGQLSRTPLLDQELLPYPAAVLNRVGSGAVVYVPCDLFRFFRENRHVGIRSLVGALVKALKPALDLEVQGPSAVDVVLRRQGGRVLVHLINRTSGLPTEPPARAVDEIPEVGPISLRLRLPAPPSKVRLLGEKGDLDWGWSEGALWAQVPRLHIHAAVAVG